MSAQLRANHVDIRCPEEEEVTDRLRASLSVQKSEKQVGPSRSVADALRLVHRMKGESVQVWDGEHVWEVRVVEVLEKVRGRATTLDVARHLMQAGIVDLAALEAGDDVPFGDEEEEMAALGE